jgi:hypothetical protein
MDTIKGASAHQEPEQQPAEEKDVAVYNPDDADFITTYDVSETGNPIEFTIPFRQIKTFPEKIAKHLKKHLATQLLNKRGNKTADGVKLSWEDSYNEYYKETEVNL